MNHSSYMTALILEGGKKVLPLDSQIEKDRALVFLVGHSMIITSVLLIEDDDSEPSCGEGSVELAIDYLMKDQIHYHTVLGDELDMPW